MRQPPPLSGRDGISRRRCWGKKRPAPERQTPRANGSFVIAGAAHVGVANTTVYDELERPHTF
jgi:hypothetical protein